MDFTYSGGTTQQRAWFQGALDGCTYPLSNITAAVAVEWLGVLGPADSKHPYMVTTVTGAGTFTISILDKADDPTNPLVQGLPNPAADIENFYKASVTHELGHIVSFSTFDPGDIGTDPRVAEMCGLFWTPTVGSGGRRYGTLADYDTPVLTWTQEIREAAAEQFKLAFCGTPTVFWNRSGWNIDPEKWGAYETLIGLGSSGTWQGFEVPTHSVPLVGGGATVFLQGTSQADAMYQEILITNAFEGTPIPTVDLGDGRLTLTPGAHGSLAAATIQGQCLEQGNSSARQDYLASVRVDCDWASAEFTITGVLSITLLNSTLLDSTEEALLELILVPGAQATAVLPSGATIDVSPYLGLTAPPSLWLALRGVAGDVHAEVWGTDPWLGSGAPLWAVDLGVIVVPPNLLTVSGSTSQGATRLPLTLSEWKLSGGSSNPVPYPSNILPGAVKSTPGLRGAIRHNALGIHGRLPTTKGAEFAATDTAGAISNVAGRGLAAPNATSQRGSIKVG